MDVCVGGNDITGLDLVGIHEVTQDAASSHDMDLSLIICAIAETSGPDGQRTSACQALLRTMRGALISGQTKGVAVFAGPDQGLAQGRHPVLVRDADRNQMTVTKAADQVKTYEILETD